MAAVHECPRAPVHSGKHEREKRRGGRSSIHQRSSATESVTTDSRALPGREHTEGRSSEGTTMRAEPRGRCKGHELQGGGWGQPPARQRRDLGGHVRRGGWEHVHTEGDGGERRMGSARSIQDIGAEASRMSEAGAMDTPPAQGAGRIWDANSAGRGMGRVN